MSQEYGTYTYNDPNFIKRGLHRGRFNSALKLINLKKEDRFLDYGCGDGYLLKILAKKTNSDHLSGYEPYSGMFKQAQNKLKDTKVNIFNKFDGIKDQKYDKISSLDTCEHLTDEDLNIHFKNINQLLKENGTILITVPVEIGLPAFFKNTYRYIKGKHYDNLNFKNFIKSIFGLRIERKVCQIDEGLRYIFSHIGFDHRKFELKLAKFFQIKKKESRPFPFFKTFFNNTVYYLLKKK